MVVLPGFVDLQVNGYLGVGFADSDLTLDAAEYACRSLLSAGTAAFLPTLITCPEDVYARNLPLLARLLQLPAFQGRLLGLHLEGPFISDRPGAVGAHNPQYVSPPDPAYLEKLLAWGQGNVRMITIAAELPGAAELARVARCWNVAISIGHSMYTSKHLQELNLLAGAGMLTHLGNGLPNDLPRHENPIWAGLAAEAYTALMITDGHHLPPEVIRSFLACKGVERVVVVSDASPVAGLTPGSYRVLGNLAVLEPSGKLHNPERQCLVGSSATMLTCMNYLASLELLSQAELMAVGFWNPLRCIGMPSSVLRSDRAVAFSSNHRRFELVA